MVFYGNPKQTMVSLDHTCSLFVVKACLRYGHWSKHIFPVAQANGRQDSPKGQALVWVLVTSKPSAARLKLVLGFVFRSGMR